MRVLLQRKMKVTPRTALTALLLALATIPPASAQQNDFTTMSQAHDAAYQAGDYARALTLSTQLIALAQRNGGEKNLPLIVAKIANGADLIALARFREAEAMLVQAEKAATALGAQHQLVLFARQNLSAMLVQQGRYKEAEPLIRSNLSAMIAARGENSPLTLTVMSTLGSVVQLQGRLTEAEPIHAKVDAIAVQLVGASDPQRIPFLSNHAALLADLGRRDEAEPLARKALDLALAAFGDRHPTSLTTLNNLASIIDDQGRKPEGEALLRRALVQRIAVLGEDHPDTLTSFNNLAQNLTDQGKQGEAEPLLRKAIALGAVKLGAGHPIILDAQATLAQILTDQGSLGEAEALARKILAARTVKVGANNPATLASMESLAAILTAERKYTEAEPLIVAVTTQRAKLFGDSSVATLASANNYTSILLVQPRRSPLAIIPARLAAAGMRQRFAVASFTPRDAAALQRETGSQREIFDRLADAAWIASLVKKSEEPALRDEAFAALQDAMAGTTSRAVALMAARNIAGPNGTALGILARERESLSDQATALEAARTATFALAEADGATRRDALTAQQTQLQSRLQAIDKRLRAEAPAYYALSRPNALTLAEAQAILRPDEAAIMIVPTIFGTHVLTLTKEATRWQSVDLRLEAVRANVANLRNGLDPQKIANGGSFDRTLASNLYQSLIAPSAKLLAGKSHLFVVADGPLASVPFSVLVTEAPSGSDDDAAAMRATKWFGDQIALIQLPSLQSLKLLRAVGGVKPAPEWSFEGFGNPILSGEGIARGKGVQPRRTMASVLSNTPTRDGGMLADVSKLKQLPGLPGTAVELEGIRAALGAPKTALHLQAAATETAIKAQDLSKTAILAFATHGLLAGEVKGAIEPGLVMTPPSIANEGDDGLLSASEITTLKLNADLIVLSACNSGGGEGKGAPALSGLARAFFYAGARSLLVSHWSVYDDVAPRITNDLISLRRANPALTKAQALQRAMRSIREDKSDDSLAFPSAWAPFVMVGDAAH